MFLPTDYLALVLLTVAVLILQYYSRSETRRFRLFVRGLFLTTLGLWFAVLLLSL